MPKQTAEDRHWVYDLEGVYALVENTDYYKPHGWLEGVGPKPDSMVWLKHEVTGGKAKFALSVVPIWAALGWHPSDPPEPVDVLHDHELVDVEAPAVVEPVVEAPKKAVSGSKEK